MSQLHEYGAEVATIGANCSIAEGVCKTADEVHAEEHDCIGRVNDAGDERQDEFEDDLLKEVVLGALSIVHRVPGTVRQLLAVATIARVRVPVLGSGRVEDLVLFCELLHKLSGENLGSGSHGEDRDHDQVLDSDGEKSNQDPVVVGTVQAGREGTSWNLNNLHFFFIKL